MVNKAGIYSFLVILLTGSIASAEGIPYTELRYSLFSNKPSVIGVVECPCYGSEVIVGYAHKWRRWEFDINNSWIYHTRWDDPEVSKLTLHGEWEHKKWLKWLGGYEITHNLDRTSRIPYNSQVEWDGVKEIHHKSEYFGVSGLHYLWVGIRIEL